MMPIQAGDVPATYADVENLGYKPATPIQDGRLVFFGYNKNGSKIKFVLAHAFSSGFWWTFKWILENQVKKMVWNFH